MKKVNKSKILREICINGNSITNIWHLELNMIDCRHSQAQVYACMCARMTVNTLKLIRERKRAKISWKQKVERKFQINMYIYICIYVYIYIYIYLRICKYVTSYIQSKCSGSSKHKINHKRINSLLTADDWVNSKAT